MLKTIFLLAVSLLICGIQCMPWDPTPRPDPWWHDRHNEFVEYSRVNGSSIRILFSGSSVCEYWRREGKPIWDQKYAPLGAVNYGIGGDVIENCLWRVSNGELDNINPELFVLYCGSNNVPNSLFTPEEIVRGITATLEDVARRLPNTKILYVGVMPREDVLPWYPQAWDRILMVNEQVLRLHDGDKMNVVSMFDDFAESYGKIKSELYLQDKLHFNLDGYARWDALWNSTFFSLLS